MRELDALAKRIVAVPSPRVCITYGDWGRRGGTNDHTTGPVKGIIEALMKRATVLPIDEY